MFPFPKGGFRPGTAGTGRGRSGFTLIEVLVSIMIIAFGCLASLNMHVASIRGKKLADQMAEAGYLADSELERLKTLSFSEISRLNDVRQADLTPSGQVCAPAVCRDGIFAREVRFFHGRPTPLSCQVEIEVSWKDVSGSRNIVRSAVLTSQSG
jgi:prepilin-type N-terminal cleavage/methylation domain-containing protein